MATVAIIGAGSVGSTTAYACLLLKSCANIIMVDVQQDRVEAEVKDLSDAAFTTHSRIRVGSLKDAGTADVIVITAGAKQRPGETRIALIERNHAILKSVIGGMAPLRQDAILLLVANPVDILTQVAQSLSGLPKTQVFGSGTFLDTQRLRLELSTLLQVSESSVHAFVLGEHGDSQFVAWSTSHVSGIPLLSLERIKNVNLETMALQVKTKAYSIIEAKGSTYYGIGACVAKLVHAIVSNTLQVFPVSHYRSDLGVTLSMPAVIGRKGIIESFTPHLNEKENAQLQSSVDALKDVVSKYT